MKRVCALILTIILSIFLYAEGSSSYDFTFYETVDNSVMGVKENKLGLDITGYGFLGAKSNKGIYIRLGVQSPFDTLLGYLNIFKKDSSLNVSAPSETTTNDSTENNISEIPNDNPEIDEPTLDLGNIESNIGPSIGEGAIFIPPDDDTIPAIGEGVIVVPTEEPDESIEDFDSSNLPEEDFTSQDFPNKDIPDIGQKEDSHSSDTPPTVVKGKEKKESFNKEWRFLITIGPAYRSFFDDKALVYLGYGFSLDLGIKTESQKKTSLTQHTSFIKIGGDLDMGFRYFITESTTIRLGTHFTASFFGIRNQNTLNSEMEEISKNIDFYGYAFSPKGLLNTMSAKGYAMLASTFRQRTKYIINYSNRTNKIGGGSEERIEIK